MKSQAHLHKNTIPDAEPDVIKKHIETIGSSHEIVEVRFLSSLNNKKEYEKIGLFDNLKSLIEEVQIHNRSHNAYIGLNPRKTVLAHAKKLNILNSQACNGNDVSMIENILIDVESIRPGRGLAASDEELEKAKKVFCEIRDFLKSRGLSGLEAESGNGFHITLGCTPYEATKENEEKVKSFLSFLGTLFTNKNAKIDESVYDLPRITRLYGGVNKKGMNTNERPWRVSKIIDSSGYTIKHDIFSIFASEIKKFQEMGKTTKTRRNDNLPDIVGLFQKGDV